MRNGRRARAMSSSASSPAHAVVVPSFAASYRSAVLFCSCQVFVTFDLDFCGPLVRWALTSGTRASLPPAAMDADDPPSAPTQNGRVIAGTTSKR